MADFIFKISPNIVLGSYTSSRLAQQVSDLGERFMLVMDPILKEGGTAEKITQSLDEKKINYFVFDEIPGSASSETLEHALKLARSSRIQAVIAAGGGRTIALAKALCSIFHEDRTVYDFLDGEVPSSKFLPLVCLPTTCRDGFIFTDRVPVTDERTSRLRLIKTQNGLCKLVLWDPNLQIALTEKQISCMALEALSYAIEGYLSQKATFFSDMILEKSVQLLGYAIDGAPNLSVTTPQEVLLTQGGCMASLGSASSSLGAGSLLSTSINSRFKISRSLTSAILLPHIIEDGATFKADRIASIARLLRAAPQEATVEESVSLLSEYVRQKIASVNIPSRLKELSLTIEQLARATEDAGELDLMNTLPRSMTTDDLFELVKKAF